MKFLERILITAGISLLTALSSAPATAAEVWKLGTAAQPGSVLYDIVMRFINDFNASAGSELQLEYQHVGNEQEMHQQVVRGRLQAGASSFAGGAIIVPEGTVFNTPYLWKNDDERAWVTDNHGVPVARKLYAEKGLELILVADVGWNDIICKTACLTPDSIKGQKMRVSPSPASRIVFKQLGANGVQMPLTEFWPGLQSGLVSGGDLPFLFYVTTPAAQSAPHYVMTRHYHHPSTFIVNKALFDGKQPALREKLLKALPAANWARRQVADTEKPKMAEFVAKGGFVHPLSDAQREAWAAVIRPGQAEMVQAIGGKAQQVFDALMEGKKVWAEKFGKK
ncbi:MAG: TRAP transporter substrate-binding protein DctP [Burkholderiaceae bacterium]|nr:TRAP transporter substrate-binding protein DctP [Burkholderiaceae bacterium]